MTPCQHMIRELPPNFDSFKVTLVYIAVTNGGLTDHYVHQFARTYAEFPPGLNHKLLVVCNGGPLQPHRQAAFGGLDCEFLIRENDPGWDISAYQAVAKATKADFLVCLGESVYFHRRDWLKVLVESRVKHGPGIYGMFATHVVRAHLNTTAFGCDPEFLKMYPSVKAHGERYEFEHGKTAFWRRIVNSGYQAKFVTWDGTWSRGEWRVPKNILHVGDQSNLLVYCNHVDRFNSANPATRELWTRQSNLPYQ